jgi:putative tricarboxylic transport membrane protein
VGALKRTNHDDDRERGTIMKRLIEFDCLFAIVAIPVAVFMIIVSYNAPRPEILQKIPPHLWPVGLLSLLILCFVVLFIQTITEKRQPAASADLSSPAADFQWYRKPVMSGVLTILGLVLYGVLLQPVGFIICTSVLVIYQARILQRGKWVRNCVSAVIFSVATYFTTKLLLIQLPAGLLPW